MQWCFHLTKREKVISKQNPFPREMSLFWGFIVLTSYKKESETADKHLWRVCLSEVAKNIYTYIYYIVLCYTYKV